MDGGALTRRGLAARIFLSLRAPRQGARLELETADEARLLIYAVAGGALLAMGRIGAEWARGAGAAFSEAAVVHAVTGLFFRPLALYLVAALIGLICRAFGGAGGWRATRTAVFWSGLVAAVPAVLVGAATARVGGVPGAALGDFGSLLWAALLGPMLVEAHGFRSVWPVYAGMAAIGAALLALAALVAGGAAT